MEEGSRCIVAANASLKFPGFERLLQEVLVGQPIDTAAGRALLELEVRYSAPFAPALRAAVQAAARRAVDGATNRARPLDSATGGDGTPPQRLTRSSP